jgi:hypothetical protein
MKTFKCIDYQQGKILVDEQAEIKEGDRTIRNGVVEQCNSKMHSFALWGKDAKKIIAQHNLNLEGIPFIELKEDVVQLCEDFYKDYQYPPYAMEKGAWRLGYKAAQPKKYTEDDLIEFALWIRHNPYYGDRVVMSKQGCKELFYKYYIQSLQPKIESV